MKQEKSDEAEVVIKLLLALIHVYPIPRCIKIKLVFILLWKGEDAEVKQEKSDDADAEVKTEVKEEPKDGEEEKEEEKKEEKMEEEEVEEEPEEEEFPDDGVRRL